MPSSKIEISYVKEAPLDVEYLANQYTDRMNDEASEWILQDIPKYNPFLLSNVQNYHPSYSRFFELNDTNYNKITLNQKYSIRENQLINRDTNEPCEKPIFFKFAPLLDPIRYMIGKYDLDDPTLKIMPTIHNADRCYPKIADINNVSYVDTFCCYLSSQLLAKHGVFNAIDFFGSYLGVQELFRVDVTDDLEYLQSSPFYNQQLNRSFYVERYEYSRFHSGSKANRQRIQIQSRSSVSLDAEVLEVDCFAESSAEVQDKEDTETVYEKTAGKKSATSSSKSSNSTQDTHEFNYSSDDDNNDHESSKESDDQSRESEEDKKSDYETGSDDDSNEEEEDIYAYIREFPTQMICLEKCDGVLDDLLSEEDFDETQIEACLFQIVMSLIIYGKAFKFTHNDLHTNNIMFSETTEKYVYYKYRSKYYRVPTYGRIFKIIDFGRSIYRFNDQLFCSDSFAKTGDAYSQYNCEPYMNTDKKRIDPNPSFDLCRLGCSMYDLVFEDLDEPYTKKKLSPVKETILRWCSDDNGKNVLYKRNGEERYPGFKLYKMIARHVHRHTPEEQLSFPLFSQFEISLKKLAKLGITDTKSVMYSVNIDEIPSYA